MGERRTTAPSRRLAVAQAADQLGVSVDAIRSRIKRGTIAHEREGGRVYVFLDADQVRPGRDQPTDRPTDRTELLIAELQDRVRSLEEANRENRRIIAALTQRIPEIEAAAQRQPTPEPRGQAETPEEGTQEPAEAGVRVGYPPGDTGASESSERSKEPWYRRWFGG